MGKPTTGSKLSFTAWMSRVKIVGFSNDIVFSQLLDLRITQILMAEVPKVPYHLGF